MDLLELRFFLLIVVAGCVVAETPATSQGTPSGQNTPQTAEEYKLSKLQLFEARLYNAICTAFGKLPTVIAVVPVALLRSRILKVGLPMTCGNIILTSQFEYPAKTEMAKLRESKTPVVWVIGGPGAGKGTLCTRMVKEEKFTHISVGDLIRQSVKNDPESFNSRVLKRTMVQGTLIPVSVSMSLLAKEMLSKLDTSNGFLIDGFPRSLVQAKVFQNKIKPPDGIIFLKASDATMEQRALGRNQGRADDNKETFQKRLKMFHDQQKLVTSDALFAAKVKEVDVEGSVDDNFVRFSAAIKALVPK